MEERGVEMAIDPLSPGGGIKNIRRPSPHGGTKPQTLPEKLN